MFDTAEEILSLFLAGTADQLDIPETLEDAARQEYERLGGFLDEHSDLEVVDWLIYPQGSFRLGTVVRPLGADHYDLDMVCRLQLARASISQEELKARVGDALDRYLTEMKGEPGAPVACHDRRRVWTLEYPHAFHLDVLPAIPNDKDQPDGICLTDKELFHWQKSNPIAYAKWFNARINQEAEVREAALAKRAEIEPFPSWTRRRTLQRVAQVLKRHRDIHFADDTEDRPPSILVTTLAGHAYNGNPQLFAAVAETVAKMPDYIEYVNGEWKVMSPVADENFADKWNEHAERPGKFQTWLKTVAADLAEVQETRGIPEISQRLAKSLGAEVTETAGRIAGEYRAASERGDLKSTAAGLLTTTAGTIVKKHGFYGPPGT